MSGELLDRVPPHDLDVERALLGKIIIDPGRVPDVLGTIDAHDFHSQEHQLLFRHLVGLHNERGTYDDALVVHTLREAGLLDRIGGEAYIAEVVHGCGAPSLVADYTKKVKECSLRRAMIRLGMDVIRGAYDPTVPLERLRVDTLELLGPVDERVIGDPVITSMADVEPRPVEWLWENRIPLAKISMLSGDPGVGKSMVTIDISARKSRGLAWPDKIGTPTEPGNVILINCEDDAADTIHPRLEAASADLTRVFILEGRREIDPETRKPRLVPFSLCDLSILETALFHLGNCRLVVIDPVSGFLTGVDSHKDAEVRGCLAPLAALAQKYRCAVLMVSHLNKIVKGGSGPAIYRTMGSLAFVAGVRAAWGAVRDPDNPHRCLFLSIKSNLAPQMDGLAYSIVPNERTGAPAVAWAREPVTVSIDEAIRKDQPQGKERREAAKWLVGLLKGGPMAQQEIMDAAAQNGISAATLRRAKKDAKVEAFKVGFSKTAWEWRLPEADAGDGQGADF